LNDAWIAREQNWTERTDGEASVPVAGFRVIGEKDDFISVEQLSGAAYAQELCLGDGGDCPDWR
jgi:hypothetical protein